MPKTYSDEFKQMLYQKYKSGESISNLCKSYNVSRSSLYNWFSDMKPIVKSQGKMYSAGNILSLQRELERLKAENEIYRISGCTPKSPLKNRIDAALELMEHYDFRMMLVCKALDVNHTTLYHRIRHKDIPTSYELRDNELRPLIQKIFEESKQRFGAPKIRIKLKEIGYTVAIEKIRELMKEMNLCCQVQKPSRYDNNIYHRQFRKDRLKRNFTTEAPNIVWVSDTTYVMVNKTFYYICVIIDLFSRKVISYEVSTSNNTAQSKEAFKRAFQERDCPSNLIFHSDQGSQYVSYEFRQYLRKKKVKQSFSAPGSPHDNAVAESFFACMKKEELHRHAYFTAEELIQSVEEYIHFFNYERPHHRLKARTPEQVEIDYYAKNSTNT